MLSIYVFSFSLDFIRQNRDKLVGLTIGILWYSFESTLLNIIKVSVVNAIIQYTTTQYTLVIFKN